MPELTAADFQRRASREAKRASSDKRRSSVGSHKERCAAALVTTTCVLNTT